MYARAFTQRHDPIDNAVSRLRPNGCVVMYAMRGADSSK